MTQTATALDLQPALDQVGARLLASLDELFPPLSNLAMAHCRDVQPYTRAAIVLTTWHALAIGEEQRENALILSSALEMLSVALSIHRLLLLPSNDNTLDKALVGSTILTGDYCFSRAAFMAAQTESPYVVELFAHALKQVSEESLRGLFGEVANPHGGDRVPHGEVANLHSEDAILAAAGVRAICHLLAADMPTTEAFLRLAFLFALHQHDNFLSALADVALDDRSRDAWHALAAWRESTSSR